ncbi:hypothetical protein V2J09_019162 [Rumex salicifolius]
MGFIFGIVIGIASGLGIMMAFAHHSHIRAKRRSELAAIIHAFARMTVEDSRKIFTPEIHPPWVLDWLNLQLVKIWPYVDEAASELIKSSVEPILEQYRPAIIDSLKFRKLTLGTVAPQFTGVWLVDGEPGEIIMELEMQWDGNPSIILDIKTLIGVALPVQVKNTAFTGVFRLIFKPLVDQLPCFGAVFYSLRQKKQLDFTLKVIGGDLSAIPGIKDTLEETIRDAIEDSISWPVRQIIPILPGDYSNLELKPTGILEVKLVEAKELSNKDLIGKSDPYAVLFVRPLRTRTKKSKTINNELNPIWNESFEFVVEDPSTQHLTVRVFDDEGLQPAEHIGSAQLLLKDLEPGKVKIVWLKLVKDLEFQRDAKNRGQVHLELFYCPFGMSNELVKDYTPDLHLTGLEKALNEENDGMDAADIERQYAQRKRHIIIRGVLSVTVISAEDLPAMDFMGKSDPYVVLTLKKSGTVFNTRVLNETLNPVWNQTFDFLVEDGLHELLMLELYDHDTIGKNFIGRCSMTLTRVLLEGEFLDTFPLDKTDSGKAQVSYARSPLRKVTKQLRSWLRVIEVCQHNCEDTFGVKSSVSLMAQMCRSMRLLGLILLSIQLCYLFVAPSVQALASGQNDGYTIAGRVKIPSQGGPGKISNAKVILNGGQKITFLRPDDVPAGTHLIEVVAIGYFFSPVRVDVSSRNPGKVHAALTETRRGLLELVLEPLRDEQYYEIREPFNILSLVKSPMGLMVGFMLIVVFLMPKLMENMDPEEMKRAQEEMRNQGVPSLTNFLSGAGRIW